LKVHYQQTYDWHNLFQNPKSEKPQNLQTDVHQFLGLPILSQNQLVPGLYIWKEKVAQSPRICRVAIIHIAIR